MEDKKDAFARKFRELRVYQVAFEGALEIYEISKNFPSEEKYSITDQIRRSSRSVCANIAEAWRKKLYPAAFAAKLSDSDAEAAETQVWLEFLLKIGFISQEKFKQLDDKYDHISSMLIKMINEKEKWSIKQCI